MNKLTDKDKTGLIAKKSNAPLGDAHELFVKAILMRLGFEVGSLDLSSGPYDIFVTAFIDFKKNQTKVLKVQVKTISGNLSLSAGSRGGIDRKYKSSVKEYSYTEKDTDLIIGVDTETLDLYFLPGRCFDIFGKSISKTKIKICKNNWDILLNWNDKYLNSFKKKLLAKNSK